MERIRLSSPIIVVIVLAGCAASSGPPAETALADARERQLDRLHAYRVRGVYPVDETGRPISVFRDAEGRTCPMAALIEQSGRADIVDRVAREDNTLRLADVRSGELMDWMESSGLTQEEIALVQGVMEIDYAALQREVKTEPRVIEAARSQVDQRLERVERTLRARRPVRVAARHSPNG